MLIRAGARIDSIDNDKQWTSIHYAVFNGHFFTVHNLIKGGANIDAKDNNGVTPLILAADSDGKERLVELLLHSGANTGLTSTYGQSCASVAHKRGDENVLNLIRNGVDEKYDPNSVVIYVHTSKGVVKRRRKKKKKTKKKTEAADEETNMADMLLSPSVGNDDNTSVQSRLKHAMRFDDDDSGVEDIRSDDDFGEDEDEDDDETQGSLTLKNKK